MASKKNLAKTSDQYSPTLKLGQPGPLHCELPGNVHNIYLSIYLHTGIPGTRYLFV